MFIKLGIIAGILILGGMIFSNEIDTLFPTTSATVFDSLKNDVSIFGSKASDSVEQRIDESIDKIVDKTTESISEEISNAGDKVTNEISKAKESSQNVIKEEISNFNPIESIQNIFTGNSNPKSTNSSSTT
jgi:predicted PurR-regulated permease PerM